MNDSQYEQLRALEESFDATNIVALATVMYENSWEDDIRVRDVLQRGVEKNLRALLNNDEWRHLLSQRPGLAADMFELVGTLLLEGAATQFPPQLPPPKHPGVPFEVEEHEELCAFVIRDYETTIPGELVVSRGEMLGGCKVEGQRVLGTGQQGQGTGYVPLDYVIFGVSYDDSVVYSDNNQHNQDDSDNDDHENPHSNCTKHHTLKHSAFHQAPVPIRKDKAAWVLGVEHVDDVYGAVTPGPGDVSEKGSGIVTPGSGDEKGKGKGDDDWRKGMRAKLENLMKRRSLGY